MKPFLELDSSKNTFTVNRNFFQLDIKQLQTTLFADDGHLTIHNFISKDDAVYVRDLLLTNSHCFQKASEAGNHRLFMYPSGPYPYPRIFTDLYDYISVLKNIIYSSHEYYAEYCSIIAAHFKYT